MLHHVVLIALRKESVHELPSLLDELAQVEKRVPEVRRMRVGPALAGSGYDAGLVVELEDAGALERYRGHPEHAPVLDRLLSVAERLEVADLVTPN